VSCPIHRLYNNKNSSRGAGKVIRVNLKKKTDNNNKMMTSYFVPFFCNEKEKEQRGREGAGGASECKGRPISAD